MEALVSSYGESSSSDSDSSSPRKTPDSNRNSVQEEESNRLPPPPIDLLNPPNSVDCFQMGNGSRVRSFPHVEGNYAVHVSIPDSQVDGRSNGNLLWTEGMDRVLVSTLQKQLSLGNKSKYGWKSIAYSAVINNMWRKHHMKIKKDHIRSRLKTWRKINAAVKEMLALGGFTWDEKRKTVKASEHVWRDALMTRKHLRQYKGKSLAFYPEIAQLVGDDQAKETGGTIPVMTNEDRTAGIEAQGDPLGADIHLDAWSPRDVGTQIPVPTHASSSSNPSRAKSKIHRKRNRSLAAGLLEEMNGMRFEIGRVASAIESKNQMDDPLWDQCADAIQAMTGLDDEAKITAMEVFVDGVEKRKMFIRLKDSQRRSWILSKIGRANV